jgi:hypothetical protein
VKVGVRRDIVPGATFTDYELLDHRGKHRTLSELQGDDPLVWCSPAQVSVRWRRVCASIESRAETGEDDGDDYHQRRDDDFL